MITYIVYKTTCLVNGKIYIGVHKLGTQSDYYLGSGSKLIKAIKKYGRKAFKRETLSEHTSAASAFEKEKQLVDANFLNRSDIYNLALGGRGGILNQEHRNKISIAMSGRKFSNEHKEKLSSAMTGRKHWNYGRKYSGDTKRFGHQKRRQSVQIDGVIYQSGKEAAEKLGVSEGTISNWLHNGKATHIL